MTIREALKKATDILEQKTYNNPITDAQLIMEYVLKKDRLYIYTHMTENLKEENIKIYFELIEKRNLGYPIQYIIKKQEFMGLEFYVSEGVLVPRQDTETLIENLIEESKKKQFLVKEQIEILDLGTGSGAITLALAHYLKNSKVKSVDISEDALKIAKQNAKNFELDNRVEFIKASMLEKIDEIEGDKFDIIVSNPPYIPKKDIEALQTEVSVYEPRIALDGGEDGLDFYRHIVENAYRFMKEISILAFEIGHNQGDDLKEMIEKTGEYEEVKVIKDLAGHDRVVLAYKRGIK